MSDMNEDSIQEEVGSPQEPVVNKQNVELENSPLIDGAVDNTKLTVEDIAQKFLTFLNVDLKELEELAENYSNIDNTGGETGKVWLAAFQQGLEHLYKGSALSKTVSNKDSFWKQKVDIDGEKIGPGKPKFGNSASGVISGEKAVLKVNSILGIGGITQIPLWHSGIWVSIKAPSEGSLLELERRIANEKITLGRYTSGMIFSNTSVYTVSYVINFILNHIYDASVKNVSSEYLKSIIKITDIPTLVWGMACTIYTNGYNYSRPCTTNPSECQHVVTGKLSLPKLFWVDNDALTEKQKRHMAKRTEKFTEEDLKAYQKEHTRGGPFTVTIKDNLKVKLKVPNLVEYEQSGFNWVDSIIKLLEGSLGISLKGDERDEYITDQGRLSALRQYAHWVKVIDVDDNVIEDEETIEAVLNSFSGDDDLTKTFFEEIGKYIDNSTIALVAIPKYKCPACGGEQVGDMNNDRHPLLLPIDVVRVFFTLLDQHMFKALTTKHL